MNKHTLAHTVIRRAYLDGMAEGVGRGALGYAEDMAGEYASANAEPVLDAAPDLLAALEEAAIILEDETTKFSLPGLVRAGKACAAARAAIAKARSEG